MRKRLTVRQRILTRAVRNESTGCLEMFGAHERGRSKIRVNGRTINTARALWIELYGDLPKDTFVCHHCDNQRCVELSHLFIGSCLENNRDAIYKGRRKYLKSDADRQRILVKSLIRRLYELGFIHGESSRRKIQSSRR